MTTKRAYVEDALSEIGLATYVFDAQPDTLQSCLKRLDAMLAEWNGRGIRIAYPIPATLGGGDLDTDAGGPDAAWQAIVCNLAIRIAPLFGRQVMRETKVAAAQGLQTLLGKATMPMEMQLRRMPLGAGNKPYRWGQEYTTITDPLLAGPDGPLEFT